MRKSKPLIAICTAMALAAILSGCSAISAFTNKNIDDYVYYGTAEADQVDISAEVAGRIKEIKVEEGQTVKAGDVIAVIDSQENLIKSQQSELSVENAKNELGKVQEGNRSEEIKAQQALVEQGEAQVRQTQAYVTQMEALVKQADTNMQNAKTTYDFKKKNYDDIKALYDGSATTKQELNNAKYALDNAQYALNNSTASYDSSLAQLNSAKAQLDSAEAQAKAAKEKLNLLVNGATDRTKNTAQLGIEQAEKSYELSKLQLDKTNVIAAVDGVIESVNFKVGEYIAPGSALATMVNPKDMWVKIYVPEKILPSVKLDKAVSMKSDFTKDKTIKGKITYISQEAEFTPMNIVTKKDRVKLVFAVKVKLTDNMDSVKPGMLLDVDIR